jgi:hypothetical protein
MGFYYKILEEKKNHKSYVLFFLHVYTEISNNMAYTVFNT